MPVAPRIVNDVSYVMRINHEIHFAWQAQYLVRLLRYVTLQSYYYQDGFLPSSRIQGILLLEKPAVPLDPTMLSPNRAHPRFLVLPVMATPACWLADWIGHHWKHEKAWMCPVLED